MVRHRRPASAAFAVALAVGPACSADGRAEPDPSSASAPRPSLVWEEQSPHVQTAVLDVPVDHADPGGAQFHLFLARRVADDHAHRIGTLLVNPGGPGVGGSDFAIYADVAFGPALLRHFDIVAWDPRGTGRTTPLIDCIDDDDAAFAGDVTPQDATAVDALVEQARAFAAGCAARSAAILEHVGTNDSARDIDAIRRALGEDRISYVGFSYGSELGATWITMFPETVRAAVLDGAVDPASTVADVEWARAAGFESVLTRFLDRCAADPSCAFHHDGEPGPALDDLLGRLDAEPLPSVEGGPVVDRRIALTAATEALYDPSSWPQLADALARAEAGDGSGLLMLWDAHQRRQPDGTWSNAAEAMRVITCMDHVERPTATAIDQAADGIVDIAPRMGVLAARDYTCTAFPPPLEPRVPIVDGGAPPVLVVGTTGDPATPLAGSRAMASAVGGRLVVVDADAHTGYGVDACVDQLVHAYLVDLRVPGATACR